MNLIGRKEKNEYSFFQQTAAATSHAAMATLHLTMTFIYIVLGYDWLHQPVTVIAGFGERQKKVTAESVVICVTFVTFLA